MRVWKYHLPVAPGTYTISTPAEWWPLQVGYQMDQIVVWAEVELTRAPEPDRRLHVTYTGDELPEDLKLSYIGSTIGDGGLVYHVYWEPPPININMESEDA